MLSCVLDLGVAWGVVVSLFGLGYVVCLVLDLAVCAGLVDFIDWCLLCGCCNMVWYFGLGFGWLWF